MKSLLKNVKKYKMKKYIRLLLLMLSIIVFFSMVFLIFYTAKYKKIVDKKYTAASYTNNAYVDYNVALVPNILYTKGSIQYRGIYITDFVDFINTNLKYEFSSDKFFDIKGKYKAVAFLEGYTKNIEGEGVKNLWKKEFEIYPETIFEGKGKGLIISKDIPIKYSYYNNFATEVIKSTGISCNVKMTILWDIDIEGSCIEGKIKEHLSPYMEMPLNVKYFEITDKLKDYKQGSIDIIRKDISPLYSKNLKEYITILILSLISFAFIVFFTSPSLPLNSVQKDIRRILKNDGYRIAELKEDIELKNRDVISIASFKDILKISDDTGKTILFRDDFNNKLCYTFYVIDGGIIYIYKLNNVYNNTGFEDKLSKTCI